MAEEAMLAATAPPLPLARPALGQLHRRLHAHHTPCTMQSLPDARSQSFEELYGPPENFLEIEVGLPEAAMPRCCPAALLTIVACTGPKPHDTR